MTSGWSAGPLQDLSRAGRGETGLTLVEILVVVALTTLLILFLANALISSIKIDTTNVREQRMSQALTTLADGLGTAQWVTCVDPQVTCTYVAPGNAGPNPVQVQVTAAEAAAQAPSVDPAQLAYRRLLEEYIDQTPERADELGASDPSFEWEVTSVRFWEPQTFTGIQPAGGGFDASAASTSGLTEVTLTVGLGGLEQTLSVLKRDPAVRA